LIVEMNILNEKLYVTTYLITKVSNQKLNIL